MKVIRIYVNGEYAFRTVNYNSCKQAVAEIRENGGYPHIGLVVKPSDKVTAHYEK